MLAFESCKTTREKSNKGPVSNATVRSQEDLDDLESGGFDDCLEILTVKDAIGNLTFPDITTKEIILASDNVTSLDFSLPSTSLLNVTSPGLENLSLRYTSQDSLGDRLSVALRSDYLRYVIVEGGGALNLLQLEDAYTSWDGVTTIDQLTTKNTGLIMRKVTTIKQLKCH